MRTPLESLSSLDPSNGALLGTVDVHDGAALDAVVEAARDAFAGSWRRDPVARAEALFAWAGAVEAQRDELRDLLAAETGKVRSEAEREVDLTLDALRYNAGIARHVDGMAATMRDGSIAHVVREPIGVSAFIVPWNWPVFLLVRDLAPALAAGVTAVVKPAPQAPLAVRRLIEFADDAGVPQGVVAPVYGGAEVGRALVEHPLVRVVSFTGSTDVGRLVMRGAAGDFTRVLLELGGKGTSVVFADADLEAAVEACVASAFLTSGQMCMANARILVERQAYRPVRDAVSERVDALRVGPPMSPDTDLGPLISEQHLERVLGYIELGRDSLLVGGRRPGGELAEGSYLTPAVIAGDSLPEALVRDEIFGPVVTVEAFDREDDGVRLANSTSYGLAAAVWTEDARRAWRVAGAIEAGTIWVNRYNRMFAEIPSGGMKQSGLGRTRGLEGVHEFTELKHINWDAG